MTLPVTMRARLTFLVLVLAAAPAAAGEEPRVLVQETVKGTYAVSARFNVAVGADVAFAVLTDYASIPRIIPDVKQSRIVERAGTRVIVEQEAVSKFMLFSKRVRLVLHIDEGENEIRFRDACGESFALYEGSWTIEPHAGGVELHYELTARP